ncbi:MAG TPA: R3H domain-containing nucleic acid-binding protein [Verrucomicrobium sp.]|nr:R3H domain-containing nucleic acid-binding protein [Verrucomicrobium sp.]
MIPPLEHARQILDTLLGYLGFVVRIEEENGPDGPTLQILTEETDALVGERGEVLDDIQYLVNRILQRRDPAAPRVRVDVEYFRTMREDRMMEKVKELAIRVRATGQPAVLNPLNSYYRRLVHNLFLNDPQVMSESAQGNERFKRITLRRRTAQGSPPS